MSTPVPHCIKINIDCFSETRKKVANGRCIKSDAVVAGGHSWSISFFPNGMVPRTTDAISLYLALEDDHDGKYLLYRVSFRFKLYDQVGGGPPRFTSSDLPGFFGKGAARFRGFERFAMLKDLEESGVLKQDRFTIGCEFTIFSASIVSRPTMRTMPASGRRKPSVEVSSESSSSSELNADLGRLLETMEGADVEFEVDGKVFSAHKIVLASRSSVFKAEFFGPTKAEETTIRRCIHINKMNPKTFEALLHYVYTDTLPEMEGKEDKAVLALDLLVAADKYNLKGLKSIAEDQLCHEIDASRVLRMFATAEGYQCWKLKKACLEFIESTKNTSAIMENGDVEILAACCPSVVKDVISKILDAREETPCDSLA